MKSSRYIRIARSMMQIIKRARIPPYLHKTSNHMYTVWQHLILLALHQYESKSYRKFVDFLDECIGVQQYLGLSKILHYTTLQKVATRMDTAMLQKILESFMIHARIKKIFTGIDATGFGHTQASYYYTKCIKLRRKFVKMSAISDMKKQIVCAIKIRHLQRHDSVDFTSLLYKANNICPISTVVADKDMIQKRTMSLHIVWGLQVLFLQDTRMSQCTGPGGYHRKMFKRKEYDAAIYHQRNKAETIFSVIKRMLGENVTSRKISM